jgi:hypothetical protein
VAPQAGVDRGRRLAVDKLVGVEVDQHRGAVGGHDLALGGGDEAALGVLEVLRVGQVEFLGIASLAFCVATSASPAVPPTPAFLPQPARASRVISSALPGS